MKTVTVNADLLWKALKEKNVSRRNASKQCRRSEDYLSNMVTGRGCIHKDVAEKLKLTYNIDVEKLGEKPQEEKEDEKVMSEYIDLVVCKHENDFKKYLFQAPPWTHLKANDAVFVDTKRGKQCAKVVDVITANKDSEEFNFIVKLAGATLPLGKVLQKVTYENFEYSEGNENE